MIKKQIAAIGLAVWLTIISVSMLITERIDLVQYYILGLIGALVIVEFMEPYYVQPRYLRYLRYLIGLGILIFVAIMVKIMMDVLGLEIVMM